MRKRKRERQKSSAVEGSGGSLLLVKPKVPSSHARDVGAQGGLAAIIATNAQRSEHIDSAGSNIASKTCSTISSNSSADVRVRPIDDGSITRVSSTKNVEHPDADNFYAVSATFDPQSTIIFFREQTTLYISGVCTINVLRGAFNLNGYRLQTGDRKRVASPLWGPAARLHCSSAQLRAREPKDILIENNLLARYPIGEVEHASDAFSSAVMVDGVALDSLEWMLAAEDLARFENLPSSITAVKCGIVHSDHHIVALGTAAVASARALRRLDVDHLTISASWMGSFSAALENRGRPSKILVCGAKGAGKSTYMRVLINRALSTSPSATAFVIDCDMGQPEFGLPGCLSLHLIREPVLEPVHLNIRTPLLSFYLGDVSSKNEPAVVLDAIRQLFERYSDELKSLGYDSKAGRPSNKYDILTCGAAERSSALLWPPLIVNTDGFIRYIGSEILLGVARTVQPCVIVQVASAKSSRVEVIEQFVREAADAGGCVEHITVEHGRPVASRVAASDLRTLRYVAYFLRHHADLISHTPYYQRCLGSKAATHADEGALNRPPALYVKTGSLVDPSGAVPRALMSMPMASYPTHSTGMYRTGPHALADELLLAAFNASLVSVSFMPSHYKDGYSGIRRIDLSGHSTDESFTCSLLRYEQFSVDRTSCMLPLLPIAGIGIVRAIDPVTGYIHILHPPSILAHVVATSSSSDTIPVLSRGLASAPPALTYATSIPLHPYTSSDVVGEGVASMKARYIVKRRSQRTTFT